MHLRLLLAALLVAAVGAATALPAAEPWIRVRSPHLEEGSSAPAHPQVLPPAAHSRLMRPGHHARAEAWVLIDSL
jgi:hypothetical protein